MFCFDYRNVYCIVKPKREETYLFFVADSKKLKQYYQTIASEIKIYYNSNT